MKHLLTTQAASLFVILTLSLFSMTACSYSKSSSVDLGTNGTLALKVDGKERIREVAHHKADGEVRIRGVLDYRGNEVSRVRFFDEQGRQICDTKFNKNSTSSTITDPRLVGKTNWTNSPAGRVDEEYWEMEGRFVLGYVVTYDPKGHLVRREFLGPNRTAVVTNLWQ